MTRVTFSGARPVTVEATAGERLLDVAQRAGQPLEGTCGGVMACATCHVVVDPAEGRLLAAPSEQEEDLLDLVPGATRGSRLACQIRLDLALSALAVRVPG